MFQPIFQGDLIRLATTQPEDREAFARWTQDDTYMRMLDDDPVRPQSGENFANFGGAIENDDYYFHLRTLADDALIGFVVLFNLKWRNLAAELAIGIGEIEYRGKGYGADALKTILNYGFSELCLNRISLTVMAYNTAAIKAYERVGFVHEGTQRKAVQRAGKFHDLVMYGVLREEWENQEV